jgi:hypothetical protein
MSPQGLLGTCLPSLRQDDGLNARREEGLRKNAGLSSFHRRWTSTTCARSHCSFRSMARFLLRRSSERSNGGRRHFLLLPPLALTAEFFEDESKQRQWAAFNTKNRLYIEPVQLQRVVGDIERFLMPLVSGVTAAEGQQKQSWPPGGTWQDQPTV